MSVPLLNLTQRKRLGSAARKAVMQYCAWKAADDGTAVFASKETIAQATEFDRSTVIRAINAFLAEGLLHVTGSRRCGSGYTTEYALDVDALEQLEDQEALVPWEERAASAAAAKQSHRATPCPEPAVEPTVDNSAKQWHGATPCPEPAVEPTVDNSAKQWHGATAPVAPCDGTSGTVPPKRLLKDSRKTLGGAADDEAARLEAARQRAAAAAAVEADRQKRARDLRVAEVLRDRAKRARDQRRYRARRTAAAIFEACDDGSGNWCPGLIAGHVRHAEEAHGLGHDEIAAAAREEARRRREAGEPPLASPRALDDVMAAYAAEKAARMATAA
jgi:hypothetical protein